MGTDFIKELMKVIQKLDDIIPRLRYLRSDAFRENLMLGDGTEYFNSVEEDAQDIIDYYETLYEEIMEYIYEKGDNQAYDLITLVDRVNAKYNLMLDLCEEQE